MRTRRRLALQQQCEHRELTHVRRFDVSRQGCLPRRPPVYELLRTHQRTLDPAHPVRLTRDWSKPSGDHGAYRSICCKPLKQRADGD